MKTETIVTILTAIVYYTLALAFAALTSIMVDGNLVKCIAWIMSIAFLRNMLQLALKRKKEETTEEIKPTNIKSKFQERMDSYTAMQRAKKEMERTGDALARGECGHNNKAEYEN